jgi:hypothetical protein
VSRPLKGVSENGISSPSLLRRGGAGPRIAALAVAAGAREFWAISALHRDSVFLSPAIYLLKISTRV